MFKSPNKKLSLALVVAMLMMMIIPASAFGARGVPVKIASIPTQIVAAGDTVVVAVNTLPNTATIKATTSSKSIATVAVAGNQLTIKGVKAGSTATITVTATKSGYQTGTAKFYVKVKAAVDPDVDTLAVSSVSAITATKLAVTLSAAVDSASPANFVIPGMTVSAASLDSTKKIASLTVAGATLGKNYTLTATGLKISGVTMPNATKSFTMPELGDMVFYSLTLPVTELKADGASQALATFSIKDGDGNLLTSASNVEVAFATTFGTFAEKRVTVQKGVATNMLTSEFLALDRTAQLTATIIEATEASLIGKKATASVLMTPNPGTADENFGASLVGAESDQADRIVAFFNKDVSASSFYTNGAFDGAKAGIIVRKDSTTVGGGTGCAVRGLLPVPGNTKALQIMLDVEDDSDNALTDNSDVFIRFSDNTGTLPVLKDTAFRLTDARKPAMLDVTNEGLTKIVVTFSEAIDRASAANLTNWSFDGTLLSNQAKFGVVTAVVGQFNTTDKRQFVTITLGTGKYLAAGPHSLQGANIGDWAFLSDTNNVMNTQTLDFKIDPDTVAPTATVTVQSPEQWVITFDRVVPETAANLAAKLTLEKYTTTWATDARVAGVGTAAVNDTNLNLVVTKLADNKSFLVQTDYDWTRVYNTSVSGKNYFNDSFRLKIAANAVTNAANGLKNVELALPLVDNPGTFGIAPITDADVWSPLIKSIDEVTKGTRYTATMNEPVKLNGGVNVNFEGATASQLQGSTGAASDWANIPVPTAYFVKTDLSLTIPATVGATFVDSYNKVLSITPNSTLGQGWWRLVVMSISDDVGNTAASATKDFYVAGEGPPPSKTFKITWAFADDDTDLVVENIESTPPEVDNYDYVYIKFSKALALTGDYKNALKTSNYTLDGIVLPTGTQILANIAGYDDLDAVVDSVTIRLPQGALQGKNAPHMINVSNLIQSTLGEALTNGGEHTLPYLISDLAGMNAYLAAAKALDADIVAASALLAAQTIVVAPSVGVVQAEYDTYATAIATALSVLSDTTKTAAQIDTAKGVLTAATVAFNADILD